MLLDIRVHPERARYMLAPNSKKLEIEWGELFFTSRYEVNEYNCTVYFTQSIHRQRMYGALTGKSKQMIANEYGEEQLKVSIRNDITSSLSAM